MWLGVALAALAGLASCEGALHSVKAPSEWRIAERRVLIGSTISALAIASACGFQFRWILYDGYRAILLFIFAQFLLRSAWHTWPNPSERCSIWTHVFAIASSVAYFVPSIINDGDGAGDDGGGTRVALEVLWIAAHAWICVIAGVCTMQVPTPQDGGGGQQPPRRQHRAESTTSSISMIRATTPVVVRVAALGSVVDYDANGLGVDRDRFPRAEWNEYTVAAGHKRVFSRHAEALAESIINPGSNKIRVRTLAICVATPPTAAALTCCQLMWPVFAPTVFTIVSALLLWALLAHLSLPWPCLKHRVFFGSQ
jgi:hypothetical protein